MNDKWQGCYEDGWQGQIVPEAFSHPAKMSYNLLQRIYDHCFDQGWLKEGDVVVDPFGGIGSTGILGAYRGVHVVCCELEPKFTGLAMHNMFLHLPKWRALGSPLPVIIQGDSRRLCELVAGVDCIVGSPPFVETVAGGGEAIQPRPGDVRQSKRTMTHDDCYGSTPGQLGSMKAGSVEAVISSPPFAEAQTGGGIAKEGYHNEEQRKGVFDLVGKRSYMPENQGQTPGNLGNLKPGDIDCVLSSPPYEGSMNSDGCGIDFSKRKRGDTSHWNCNKLLEEFNYGKSQGQLGQEQGPTFWAAAKEIVEQCHQILKEGGHAIWVVKDFVRKGQKVDFTGDWRRLCESVGFETVCIHHAMLVKESKMQTLFGHTHTERTERKSFFRRLAEAKGCPPINYEVVICMQKQGREE
jgi:hypothetical protein